MSLQVKPPGLTPSTTFYPQIIGQKTTQDVDDFLLGSDPTLNLRTKITPIPDSALTLPLKEKALILFDTIIQDLKWDVLEQKTVEILKEGRQNFFKEGFLSNNPDDPKSFSPAFQNHPTAGITYTFENKESDPRLQLRLGYEFVKSIWEDRNYHVARILLASVLLKESIYIHEYLHNSKDLFRRQDSLQELSKLGREFLSNVEQRNVEKAKKLIESIIQNAKRYFAIYVDWETFPLKDSVGFFHRQGYDLHTLIKIRSSQLVPGDPLITDLLNSQATLLSYTSPEGNLNEELTKQAICWSMLEDVAKHSDAQNLKSVLYFICLSHPDFKLEHLTQPNKFNEMLSNPEMLRWILSEVIKTKI